MIAQYRPLGLYAKYRTHRPSPGVLFEPGGQPTVKGENPAGPTDTLAGPDYLSAAGAKRTKPKSGAQARIGSTRVISRSAGPRRSVAPIASSIVL